MSLVGKKAPKFFSPAVVNGNEIVEAFSLEQYIGKKNVVFFFYPGDFTFVCPTEILSYQKLLPEFEKRNAVVVGCSTDSHFSHYRWLMTPVEEGGIEGVTFPLVADHSMQIAERYGVLAGEFKVTEEGAVVFDGEPIAYRATFVIDKEGIIRHEMVNDVFLGRNTLEALRVLDAMEIYKEKGVLCPADWEKGKEVLYPEYDDYLRYIEKMRDQFKGEN